MHFAYPLPWWLALVLAAVVGALTYLEYRRPLAPLTTGQRATLAACRASVLAILVLFLFRPLVLAPPESEHGAVVPVLVDRSRSMRLDDADGQARLARALSLLNRALLPALTKTFTPELYSVGDRLEAASLAQLRPDGRKSDLRGALAAVRDRYRGRHVAGIVLLTDGGDTGQSPSDVSAGIPADVPSEVQSSGPPVFAIGFGSPDNMRDREITGMAAGEQRLDQATVDLRVSAMASGFGRAPFVLRLLANGREIESRRLTPAADGAPVDEVFTVAPNAAAPTVYTAEIPADASESIPENNARSVLVNPAGRRRRLLMIEGLPGFEHSFMRRAWARDPDLEVDAVGRKGKNVDGQDTFFVQAAAARTGALMHGFPARREDLYAYDGIILANVEGDLLAQAQLAMIADFVSERGGGLLVVGGRSFAGRGLVNTPVEVALPVELSDRRGRGASSAAALGRDIANKLVLTPEGERHPAMRIGDTPVETRRLWAAFPALPFTSPVGVARAGATVLAVTSAPTGEVYPLVAVQRYGRGRSMTFSGEATWRWRMLLPSTDRSFELFWRHAARWIVGAAPDPVSISLPENVSVGDDLSVEMDVRDGAFAPVGDAVVEATVTTPGGDTRPLKLRRMASAGRYAADLPLDEPGLYRVNAEAQRLNVQLGAAARWSYAGAVDPEFADPRLNEAWLRRVTHATGGRYVRPAEASKIVEWLRESPGQQTSPTRRDLWHQPWVFGLIVALLSAEWILRRRWGLR
jgi:uncharacterized membrane protein